MHTISLSAYVPSHMRGVVTDRRLGHKVSDLDKISRVCVHEDFKPGTGFDVLDLHDMCQGERAVLRNELDS